MEWWVIGVQQAEVLRVLDLLGARDIAHWIGGGWGIDALAAQQTREHDDLDLALDQDRLDDVVAMLRADGYLPETDRLPVRLQLCKQGVGAVDLHPLELDVAGNGRQAGRGGTHFGYPAVDLGIGWLAGRAVPTISARLQREFHQGYELHDKDTHDLAVLDRVDGRLRSGFVVEIPAADPVVHEHRLLMDRGAQLGVPAHVTVLFPFAPPALIGAADVQRAADVCRSHEPFEVTFGGTDWFEQAVLWAAPVDPGPFRALTAAFAAAFPAYPPYGGEFDDVVPHLTIADRAPQELMLAAERAVQQLLPVRQQVTRVSLFVGSDEDESWVRLQQFPLGSGSAASLHTGQSD
ncbi:MAG: 2'-5' RNA ligase family protein [Actinomycetota bacterium]|nr:2'-5' RNA ligase family protein [Actinomycetota bacterium]